MFPYVPSRWQHRAVCIHPCPGQQGSPTQPGAFSGSQVWPLPSTKPLSPPYFTPTFPQLTPWPELQNSINEDTTHTHTHTHIHIPLNLRNEEGSQSPNWGSQDPFLSCHCLVDARFLGNPFFSTHLG